MSILDAIVEEKAREIVRLPPGPVTVEAVRAALEARGGVRDFFAALQSPRRGDTALIAEVKKASPSAGVIRPDFDPVAIARQYETGGASCLSVLTDVKFFQGSLDYLKAIRTAVELPLLRKDFIIDERQILEAAQGGADAVLLIVAILEDDRLRDLLRLVEDSGLTALVEVHDEVELDRAVAAGARLIGVNNRNLKSFEVDLATTGRVARRLREHHADHDALLVAESGIHAAADVQRVAKEGARAILVGESLMKHFDIPGKIRELLAL